MTAHAWTSSIALRTFETRRRSWISDSVSRSPAIAGADSAATVLGPQEPGRRDHRRQLAVRHLARQILHPAVGGEDHLLRLDVRQRALDALHDGLRRLD